MQRNLTCQKFIVHNRTVLFGVFNRLIQDIVLGGIARTICKMPGMMAACDKFHAGILLIRIVNRQPDRDRLRRGQWPVTRILVPGDRFSVMRHFAEEVRAPADDVLAQQITYAVDNPGVCENIVDFAILQMGRADRIAVPAGCNHSREEIIEVGANLKNLRLVKNRDWSDITFGIELFNLRVPESLGLRDLARIEIQIPLHCSEFSLIGNHLKRRFTSHRFTFGFSRHASFQNSFLRTAFGRYVTLFSGQSELRRDPVTAHRIMLHRLDLNRIRLLIFQCIVLSACSRSFAQVDVARLDGFDFFEKNIRPVLIQHCYECHSAKAKTIRGGLLVDSAQAIRQGGDSGPALVPGDPSSGTLLEALRYESFEMPPRGKLPQHIIDNFETWIKMGAPDPRTEPTHAPPAPRIDLQKGRKFWSFQPVRKPSIPQPHHTLWPRNEIDLFILARLEEQALHPANDANELTLLRRLYFDLTGLPPSVQQISEFLANPSPQKIEQTVDELLNSPEFGRLWGRHWLDLARYSDSTGGGRSLLYETAWRYRNYVIDAFNQDKPFNDFLREQIAGDLLDPETPTDSQIIATGFLALGPHNYENQDKEQLRMDVVDEQIDTIGRVFMAMTIGCARCHDHKFDPIPTTDYYALAGIFRSTNSLVDGNVSKWVSTELPLSPDLQAKRDEHAVKLANLKQDSKILHDRIQELKQRLPAIQLDNHQAELTGTWQESTSIKGFIGLNYQHSSNLGDAAEYRFEGEPRRYSVQVSYTPAPNRTRQAGVTIEAADGIHELKIDQQVAPNVDGMFHDLGDFAAGSHLVVTVRPTEKKPTIIDSVRLIAIPDANNSQELAAASELDEAEQRLRNVENELELLKKREPEPGPTAISVAELEEPADYNVCIRGDVHQLGQAVERGFLSVIETNSRFSIPEDQSGRLQLANWLVDPEHPLTARVYVNRIWHQLFGTGLVRTVDNFGVPGEVPSHPELLDYLALQFIEDGWSTKSLIRRIVLSRTYQLSSEPETRASVDPENRLLSHQNRKRLRAEAILDSLLFCAGKLDLSGSEDSIRPGTKSEYGYEFEFGQRAVYLPVFRNRLPDLFSVFDFPDPNLASGRRTSSTIAPQSLFLMNSSFLQAHADATAQLALAQVGESHDRLRWLILTILNREPHSDEIRLFEDHLGNDAEVQEKWTAIAKALFSSLDFRYLD